MPPLALTSFSEQYPPANAAPHGDARDGGVIDGTQLTARGCIDILRHIAVGKLDAAGHAVVVVLNKHNPLARVGNQRAVGVVLERAAVRCVAVEVEGSVVQQLIGIVADIVQAVALHGDVQVVYLSAMPVVLPAAPLQSFHGPALGVLQYLLVEVVLVVVESVTLPVDAFCKPVQRVVCELVATLLGIVVVAPLLYADVAVVAGSARASSVGGIIEFLLEARRVDSGNPTVQVVPVADRSRTAGTGYRRHLPQVVIGDGLYGA